MSNKKQTAVGWIYDNIQSDMTFMYVLELIRQAKELEKQQIIDAWENGYDHGACVNEDKDKYHGIQYYKETYEQ
jgi:hypothetical protein